MKINNIEIEKDLVAIVERLIERGATIKEDLDPNVINNWDVSKVTNMTGMFDDAESFNQPLDTWDVSKVLNMRRMFEDARSFNQPINNWDVSKVKDMRFMFYKATSFNQPLNSWNVSIVTNMCWMFGNCGLAELPEWYKE